MTKADIWQQHITDWESSNLSQTQFCKQHNIVLHNFQYWRKCFAKATRENKSKPFIPITVSPISQVRVSVGSQISIELPSDGVADLIFSLQARGLIHVAT